MTALRVLYVDDEPDIREIVEMSLGLGPGIRDHDLRFGGKCAPPRLTGFRRSPVGCHDAVMDGPDNAGASAPESAHHGHPRFCSMTARAQTREFSISSRSARRAW